MVYFVRLARRNLVFILLSLVLAVTAALVVAAKTPPKYEATITMLVSGHDKEGSLATALQSGALSQQRVQSYANLLTSRRVVGRFVPAEEVRQVQSGIRAEAIPMTMLLRATLADHDPRRAARLVNALGRTFSEVIGEIERPTPNTPSAVRITVVDQAEPPTTPVSPRPLVNLVVAVLLALLITASWIVLRDHLDSTVKSSEALQDITNSPTLGIIGYERDARRTPLILRDGSKSSRSEAFRSLRTNLQFIGVDWTPRSLVVTSCLQNEGKSSIATNLALTFAQAGWRVILVDGDLRRPTIPEYLGIEGSSALTDVLINRVELADAIQTWGEPSMSVLPSGRIPPNPSELLGSQNMRKVIAELVAQYDIVIIDAPPLLPVTDAATLAAICDDVLLVARYGRTRRESLVRAGELLSSINARVVGTVLNFAPRKSSQLYGYGYGYGPKTETETEVKTPANV
ncbi:polysaccharide biosynthesis tyrosine autokinase [Sphaerisporangium flaviroseum]